MYQTGEKQRFTQKTDKKLIIIVKDGWYRPFVMIGSSFQQAATPCERLIFGSVCSTPDVR